MNENQIYYDFAKKLKEKLLDEINGRIEFEIYPNIDAIIIKTTFKEFTFTYACNGIQHKFYNGDGTAPIVEDFKKEYIRTIKRTFFKRKES